MIKKKKDWAKYKGNLFSVNENSFSLRGSPFCFVPRNKRVLEVLNNSYKGVPLIIFGYKTSKDSRFIRVARVIIDRYKNSQKADTRRLKALSECQRETLLQSAHKRKLKVRGTLTGLTGKGEVTSKGRGINHFGEIQ